MKILKLTALAAAMLLALTACGGDDTSDETAAPASEEPAASTPATPGECDFTPPEQMHDGKQFKEPPAMEIDENGAYTAVMETSCGTMNITLLPANAPNTVNSFVFLANEGWYEGILFHRIIQGFVIQAGDPLCSDRSNPACGTGGAGYEFKDELSGKETYAPGTVAMANSGPDTNGSQFFIVTGPDAASLPPSYTVFGELADEESLAVAQTIEKLPVVQDAPEDSIWIRSVTVEEG